MPSSILVRGVSNKVIYTNEYILVKIYLRGTITSRAAEGYITIEVHLVDNLKANLLIRNDTLKP